MLLLNGDCIEEMQKMIDEGVQVDSVVTDPPYELGFMGKSWDSTGIAFQKETWELAYQLLKPGGHLLAFSSSRTYHRMAVAIEDSGFEIRDQIMWLYGTKSCGYQVSISKTRKEQGYRPNETNATTEVVVDRGNTEHEGWGTALKPAHEPIVMARKPLSEKSIADNVLKHGTGGINIDGCRIQTQNELGRFPANVMHDGLETEWARYFYCPKVSRAERNVGLDDLPDVIHKTVFKKIYRASAATREVNPIKNNHPTVKPQKLMKYLCRLVTPKDGTVLDPFMGSGSTGMAAKDGGFDFIGIEREKEYFEIAESRINITAPLSEFFE
jgi:DNA modification methylase